MGRLVAVCSLSHGCKPHSPLEQGVHCYNVLSISQTPSLYTPAHAHTYTTHALLARATAVSRHCCGAAMLHSKAPLGSHT
eukprot:7805-Heterococcus_DN1.PRE.2